MPDIVRFGPKLPGKTPTKLTLSVLKGTASQEIKDMLHKCTGIPVKVYPNKQIKCSICHKVKTAWYCIGCKRWVCMERKDTKQNAKEFKTYSHAVRGVKKVFHKCCFHETHQDAWMRMYPELKENLPF